MITEAYLSGDYRKWEYSRTVQAPKFLRRVRVPGLKEAMKDPFFKAAELTVNGFSYSLWEAEANCIKFSFPMIRGVYRIHLKITYTDLEKPVYRRS